MVRQIFENSTWGISKSQENWSSRNFLSETHGYESSEDLGLLKLEHITDLECLKMSNKLKLLQHFKNSGVDNAHLHEEPAPTPQVPFDTQYQVVQTFAIPETRDMSCHAMLELYPCLYNKQDNRYKDSTAKNNAWKAVAEASGLNGSGKFGLLQFAMFDRQI